MIGSRLSRATRDPRVGLAVARSIAIAALLCVAAFPAAAFGLGYRPVISQVYGGGSSAGATFGYDYIELHNPAPLDVSVEGWSVQYASRTGTFNARTDLHGIIPAGGYLLVQEGGPGPALPVTPDIVGTIAMHNESAKVALVRDTTLIGGDFTSPRVIDFVGYGAEASYWEGPAASYVPNLSPTRAAVRKSDGNQDTDNNAADFDATDAPGFTPRNRTSTSHALAGPMAITLTATSFTGTQAAGTALATLGTTDPERTGPFAYSLVTGTGDGNNAEFSITGDTLYAPSALGAGTYTIRVRSTDPSWLGYEQALALTVRAQSDGANGTSSATTTVTPRLPDTGLPPAPKGGAPAAWVAVVSLSALCAPVVARSRRHARG